MKTREQRFERQAMLTYPSRFPDDVERKELQKAWYKGATSRTAKLAYVENWIRLDWVKKMILECDTENGLDWDKLNALLKNYKRKRRPSIFAKPKKKKGHTGPRKRRKRKKKMSKK